MFQSVSINIIHIHGPATVQKQAVGQVCRLQVRDAQLVGLNLGIQLIAEQGGAVGLMRLTGRRQSTCQQLPSDCLTLLAISPLM